MALLQLIACVVDPDTASIVRAYVSCRACHEPIEEPQYLACDTHTHYFQCLEYLETHPPPAHYFWIKLPNARHNEVIYNAHKIKQERLEEEFNEENTEPIEFGGWNCDECRDDDEPECAGWIPGHHRCECGNRRVQWCTYAVDMLDPELFDTFCATARAY